MSISLELDRALIGLPAVTRRQCNRDHYAPQKWHGRKAFAAELRRRLQSDGPPALDFLVLRNTVRNLSLSHSPQ